MKDQILTRCPWCGEDDLYRRYHDEEWGVPERSSQRLFEFLILEGAQAGLAWISILRRRDDYRRAFAGFDPERIASFDESDVHRLLQDRGIIRNRQKILSAINNARRYIEVEGGEPGGFSRLVWAAVGGRTMTGRWHRIEDVPAETAESRQLSKELKRRGFTFVGPVIGYAYMQACGLVNDHLVNCFRHAECGSDPAARSMEHGRVDP